MKLTTEQIHNICEEYKGGLNIAKLCHKYSIYPYNIYSILKHNNITKRGHTDKIDESLIENIIKDVENGLSINQARKKYNISKSSATKYLKLKNFHSSRNKGCFHKIYDINENFLETIDSPEKAQVLGILFADGSVSSTNKLISLRLNKNDSEYLEKIKSIIGSNKPLYFLKGSRFISPLNKKTYKRNDTAILDITNKIFYNFAIKNGLVPNKKQLNVHMPPLNPILNKFFILGYFEGDGCITWTKNTFTLQFAGCYNLCSDIKKIIYDQLQIDGSITKTASIYILSYKRINDIIKIISWLYQDCTFKMKRKYEKCKLLMKILNAKKYFTPAI